MLIQIWYLFLLCLLNDIVFRHLMFDKSCPYHWDVEKIWQQNICSYILYCRYAHPWCT